MKKISILDCTLRDGAYIVDMIFGDSYIRDIIESLCNAGIDIIECGFLRNTPRSSGSTEFFSPGELEMFMPKDYTGKSKFVLMIDSGRYDINNLEPNSNNIVFAIRDCFHKEFKNQAFNDAETIIKKGYNVFIQPTGILGYTDAELLDLINETNNIHAYSFAIVDTFGSMTKYDLVRLFRLIDHNLDPNIKISFHSHNNLQMAFALAQEFIGFSQEGRDVIVDTTVYGMGRGAGNTNTELVLEYLNNLYQLNYDINPVLDLIDSRILQIYNKHHWGYNIRNFVAGTNSCHVDNISYLYDKGTIPSKDIKMILEEIPLEKKKHFNKKYLDDTCFNYFNEHINDSACLKHLNSKLKNRDVLLLFPGKSLVQESAKLTTFINANTPIIISINFVPTDFKVDYIFCSNPKRYNFMIKSLAKNWDKVILTSNIVENMCKNKIDIYKLIKRGWKYYDNSGILCLRLLDRLSVNDIYFAGFDGYAQTSENYITLDIETIKSSDENQYLNFEISQMLSNFKETMRTSRKLEFLTESRFKQNI